MQQPLEDTMRAVSLGASLVAASALFVTALTPTAVAAQSDLDVSEAGAFLGAWVISINSDYGPFTFDLEIADHDGKVGATISSPEIGMTEEITDISRSGEGMVLKYQSEYEGQVFPVQIELEPDGDGLSVGFDAADGQFFAMGKATKSAP
jgi:hypothetical protein